MPAKTKALKNLYGIVIKVENVEVCRPFYRDVLGLGAPVVDSRFWVEFKLDGHASLILEKVMPGEKTPVGRGKTSWFYHVKDIESVLDRLKKHGHDKLSEENERLGYKIHLFCDPEGNPFYLISDKENTIKE